MSHWVYYCDFYPDVLADDQDAYQRVWHCCGGPFEERPYGHYSGCVESPNAVAAGEPQ